LKLTYRKWPRIGHLDICSPSYGQKKGRESNWQFNSRPLKVGNRPVPDVRSRSATWRWKLSLRATTLVQTSSRSKVEARSYEVPKSRDSNRDSISGVSGKSDIRMPLLRSNAEYTIGSKVVAYSRVRAVVSLNTQGCLGMRTNHFVVCFDADSSLIY
jgi:hypothetical protein